MPTDETNGQVTDLPSNEDYDKAAKIAEDCMEQALERAGDLDFLVAIMMIETAVNTAAELTSDEDVLRLLQDLAEQVQQSIRDDA